MLYTECWILVVADALRTHTGGLLKSQMIDGAEYPPYVPAGMVIENHGPLNVKRFLFFPEESYSPVFSFRTVNSSSLVMSEETKTQVHPKLL
jgi:hypothetical protein